MREHEGTEDSATGSRSLPPAAVDAPATARAGRGAPARDVAPGGEAALDRSEVPALIVGDDHRIRAANRQCHELFAGQRLIGRRCYQVFHHRQTACEDSGQRCPLRHFRDTGEPCRVVHVHFGRRGRQHHEVSILPDSGAGLGACLELRPVTVSSPGPCPCRLVGRSPAFNRMLELLLRAAPRSTPVLLLGELGTCRETVARALHRLGGKPDGAFAALHCPGLRGEGFTRELAARVARLDRAGESGGSLYLDDAGELGAGEQGELLRWLKTAGRRRGIRPDRRPGSHHPRLICAARPDLRQRVARGDFLDDLYYRVSIFPISVPTLRQRREDLPLLVECLLGQISGEPPPEIAPRTFEVLGRYPFPGNLRELRRILEHASLEAAGRPIQPEDLPPECRLPG